MNRTLYEFGMQGVTFTLYDDVSWENVISSEFVDIPFDVALDRINMTCYYSQYWGCCASYWRFFRAFLGKQELTCTSWVQMILGIPIGDKPMTPDELIQFVSEFDLVVK